MISPNQFGRERKGLLELDRSRDATGIFNYIHSNLTHVYQAMIGFHAISPVKILTFRKFASTVWWQHWWFCWTTQKYSELTLWDDKKAFLLWTAIKEYLPVYSRLKFSALIFICSKILYSRSMYYFVPRANHKTVPQESGVLIMTQFSNLIKNFIFCDKSLAHQTQKIDSLLKLAKMLQTKRC